MIMLGVILVLMFLLVAAFTTGIIFMGSSSQALNLKYGNRLMVLRVFFQGLIIALLFISYLIL